MIKELRRYEKSATSRTLTAMQATLADMSNDIRDIKAETCEIKLVQNRR